MKNLSTLDIIDNIAFIEDGINAARVVALGYKDIVTEETRDEAVEWVFNKLMDSAMDLRAELTRKLAIEKNADDGPTKMVQQI